MKLTKLLGLAAVGGLLILAAPTERAQAVSLANPGAAAAVEQGSRVQTTQAGWHRHWHRHHRCWRCRW